MRFYLMTIQFNKDTQSENRTVPKAFDNRDDAIAEFHSQMGKDMKNSTLGWALSILFDSDGVIVRNEKWTRTEPVEE